MATWMLAIFLRGLLVCVVGCVAATAMRFQDEADGVGAALGCATQGVRRPDTGRIFGVDRVHAQELQHGRRSWRASP